MRFCTRFYSLGVCASVVLLGCGGQTTHPAENPDASNGGADGLRRDSSVSTTSDAALLRDSSSFETTTDADASDAGGSSASMSDADLALGFASRCSYAVDAGADGGSCGTMNDPRNCGSCGNDCNGGACDAGACVPLPAGVLATGQSSPVAIAVDDTNVYWLNLGVFNGPGGKAGGDYVDGQVMSCAIPGCANKPTILASGWTQSGGLPVVPSALAVDSTRVYWGGDLSFPFAGMKVGGLVLSCAIGGCGCTPTEIGEGVDDPTGLAVWNNTVYFTQYDVGQLTSCPVTGCNTQKHLNSSQVGPTAIVIDSSGIYWTDIGGILNRCALPDCAGGPTTLWKGQGTEAETEGLAADATNLYWTNGNPLGTGSVFQCAKSNCAATATALATNRSSPRGIASDGTNVYWSESGVYRCAVGGCNGSPTSVAPNASGQALALHGSHLYATTSDEILVLDK